MAINIDTLITGSMAIGSSGGSSGHAETIFTFTNNRTVSKNISGDLTYSIWKEDNEGENPTWEHIFNYDGSEKLFMNDLISVDIGNTVTGITVNTFSECFGLAQVIISNSVQSIGGTAFEYCDSLTNLTIPQNVTIIDEQAFFHCGLTNVTFEGRTMEQVQAMDNYPFGAWEKTITCSDGQIEIGPEPNDE